MDLIIAVPDANHVESTLGANSHSKKGVVGIFGDGAEHNANAVLEEHVGGVLTRNAHTVGAATDVSRILPHRRDRVLHKAEEPVQKRVVAERIHQSPELRPSAHRRNRLIGSQRPASLVWRVVPKSPCTTGNGIIGH